MYGTGSGRSGYDGNEGSEALEYGTGGSQGYGNGPAAARTLPLAGPPARSSRSSGAEEGLHMQVAALQVWQA